MRHSKADPPEGGSAVSGVRFVGVKHRLAPWRVAAARRAVASLELPAGRAAEVGVEKGDVLVFEDVADAENG
jgi:uncharacterized membrane protein (UPF0127 family)